MVTAFHYHESVLQKELSLKVMLLDRTDFARPPSAEVLSQFATNAYVICRRVLSPDRAGQLREKALEIAARHARSIEQQSLDHPLRYRVVTGDVIATEWPELFATYQSSELRNWVAAISGMATVVSSPHLQSCININIMGEPGEVYRWHTDASGVTLLLYLSDSREEDGGSLQLRAPGASTPISMFPTAGTVVLMDGTRCLHRVSPIVGRHERVSIPMVFTPNPAESRPEALDDYLYGAR
jgi:2OG-Fe(II) oxygenase superfamily